MRFINKFLEMKALVGGLLKYGAQRGDTNATCQVQCVASLAITNNSGKFVTMDVSGYAALTSVGAASIFGWIDLEEKTMSATAGSEYVPCIVNTNAIFRLPVGAATACGASLALWRGIIGKKCDLKIVSNVQYVNCDSATAGGHVIIVGQDSWIATPADTAITSITASTGCRWVDVKINGAIQGK